VSENREHPQGQEELGFELARTGRPSRARRSRPAANGAPAATIETFADALAAAEPRPADADDDQKGKKNYAERLSNAIAVLIANELRETGEFQGILPNPDGTGRETKTASGARKKLKKTDVRFSTFDTGLELLVSIKTLSFRDRSVRGGETVLGRYTKNMVRNDHELRAEATDLHERHPYAVLVAMLFLPFTACDDAANDKSSFAHAVMTFRARIGRELPSDPHQLFERLFIGLYEHEGERVGEVWFFDVADAPPRRGRPKRRDPRKGEPRRALLSLDEVIAEIVKTYGIRNRRYIEWADEEDESERAPDLGPAPEEDVEEEDDD
jgi:hypothetical protein